MMDLYGHGLGYSGRPTLGLEEGQVKLTCGPGQTKVYLQEFPWEKCVQDSELEAPAPAVEPEELPGELIPEETPQEVPEEPAPYQPSGKARFLEIDPATGAVLDPDTGEPIQAQSVLMLRPVETVATAVGVIAVIGLTLIGLGVFGSGGKKK
jgi:hypothetical protein